MQFPRSSTVMKLSLSAILAIAMVAITIAYLPHYSIARERLAVGRVSLNITVYKRAMKMDLWGGIRPTDRPAAPFGDWDEDVFVELVTEIHITLLKLGGIENITISWPPHDIDVSSLPAGWEVDPRVALLMRHLPIARRSGDNLVPNIVACDFLRANGTFTSRMIDERNWFMEKEGGKWVAPPSTAFPWLCTEDELMPKLILDVADNSIHFVGEYQDLHDTYTKTHDQWYNRKKLEDYQCDYRNWPSMSATEYLKSILANLREGVWIPLSNVGLEVLDPRYEDLVITVGARRTLLMDVYGWPDRFREEAWKKEVQNM